MEKMYLNSRVLDQRCSDNDSSNNRDIPSFIEPMPPLISNPFMRPRPQKGTNLLELFEEDSEIDEPELLQVYLRLKPHHAPNNLYEVRSDRCLITSVDTATAGHGRRTQHNVSKMYTFSHIFDANSTQKDIFEHVVKDNLKKLPDGHNFTLLTYGASGSGKTFTLMGTVAAPGLVPRSLEYVFKVIDAAQQPLFKPGDGGTEKLNYAEQDYELQWVKRLRHVSAPLRDKYRRMSANLCNDLTQSTMDLSNRTKHYVWVSFIEIYNEGIYDLLATTDRSSASKLRIREDASGEVYIKGATQAFVRSGTEAYDVMAAGKHNLQVAATGVHAHSSRSHCIFTITMLTDTDGGIRTSCVRLCDLAGCERARHTRNTGARMAESRAINASLHVLERCLHTLRRRTRHKRPTVPYRESKLTRVLGSGLSGTRGESVSMVVTLNPAPEYAQETRHVLQLAAVARDIQVNNTIAESTFETTRDTNMSCASDVVVRLRADNERTHFELLQAQSRNKELLAIMEEKQREAAVTMQELVEEAKDMTRQYYETQLQALRAEMKDMMEECECRERKADAATEANTPSKALQNKVTELMTEIALLEEQLTAERLARACAEEEVQHLRACIEERDEKENSSSNRDVIMLTDSEHDSDEDNDICNESLEPIFKREDINKSRLLIKNLLIKNATLVDSESVYNARDTSCNNTENHESISVNKFHDNSSDGDSIHDKNGEESVNDTIQKDIIVENVNTDINTNYNISNVNLNDVEKDASVDNVKEVKYNLEDMSVGDNVETAYKMDSVQYIKNLPLRGTYFVKTTEDLDNTNDLSNKISDTANAQCFARGTYFVSNNNSNADDSKAEKSPVQEIRDEKFHPLAEKVSGTLVNKIIKSMKYSHSSDNSLAHFEQLEMAAKNCNDTNGKTSEVFSNLKILKEKKNFFDDKLPNETTEKLLSSSTKNKLIFDSVTCKVEKVSRQNIKDVNNELQRRLDDTRSPSIVKDEVQCEFKPSTMKILLGENVLKPTEVLSANQILRKKQDSVDMFEGLDSPCITVKGTESHDIVENARKSIEQLVLDHKSVTKVDHNIKQEGKLEPAIILEEPSEKNSLGFNEFAIPNKIVHKNKDVKENSKKTEINTKVSNNSNDVKENKKTEINTKVFNNNDTVNESRNDNTIDEFENIYKNLTIPRATEFDLLVSQDASSSSILVDKKVNKYETSVEETKYNLRHKAKTESLKCIDKKEDEEVVLESYVKSERLAKTKVKKSLCLRKKKNQIELNDKSDQEMDKLKDVVNLQAEFSDVTMDVPAPLKEAQDIASPEKQLGADENVPPEMGLQSCPSKSVTRSRRKLFTPRAEPLDEDETPESGGRIHVPRPSYHRPRARRKL